MNPVVTENLRRVARSLHDLQLDGFVFVGGAAVGLLLTDPAAPEPRFTIDIDIVTHVQSRGEYHKLEELLRKAGHVQPSSGPICRWSIDGVLVDIMPMDATILGFTNPWYPELVEHAEERILPDGSAIMVASSPYLIASKLAAFHGRGSRDYRFSRDLEDVIILFDGRPELTKEIKLSQGAVRSWIGSKLKALLSAAAFLESISEHLPPDEANQARRLEIVRRMREVLASDA